MKPKVGSVLHGSLLQTVEHTGIYVGWNKVVHLNGDGIIEKVSYAEFIGRLDGMNPTIAICCPVDRDNNPIGDKEVEGKLVNYRMHGSNETISISTSEFVELLNNQIKSYK